MRNNAPTILIVEDDERIRSLMRTVLAGAGYATLETGNAATAVSMLASHSPDLMVLDLGLPDRDGQELLSEIRACLGYHSKCNRKERIGHRKALC